MKNFIDQLREELGSGETAVSFERVSQLLDLLDCLARRYASLSDFVGTFPGMVYPGPHSAREIETNPDSKAFFDLLSQVIRAKQEYAKQEGERVRYRCQCCGLPTLQEDPAAGTFEICGICHWEHEPIADPSVATGGPNGVVSLAEARKTFERSFTMYEEGDTCSI